MNSILNICKLYPYVISLCVHSNKINKFNLGFSIKFLKLNFFLLSINEAIFLSFLYSFVLN